MKETNHRPVPDALDRATETLRGAPVSAGPPAELIAATLAAIQNRLPGTVPVEVFNHKRRRRIMGYIGFGSVTAAAVALVALMWSPARSDAAMLETAMTKAKKAESFRAKITLQTANNASQEIVLMSQNGKVRIEMDMGATIGPIITIVDYPRKKALSLFPMNKGASWHDEPADVLPLPEALAKRLAAAEVPTMADAFGELKGAKFEPLPDAELGNRKAKVFFVKEFTWPGDTEKFDITLWIDPKTETILKFRFEVLAGLNKGAAMEGLLFDWNEKLDETKFDLNVPKGYTEINKPEVE